jgi:hypothetical protein
VLQVRVFYLLRLVLKISLAFAPALSRYIKANSGLSEMRQNPSLFFALWIRRRIIANCATCES